MMGWIDPDMFESGNHGNKPFSIRVPALVVTRGKNDRINFLTAMWFTPTGFEPSRMVVAIQKRTLTYEFLLERGEFVMSAPTDKMMDVVVFAGYISGHDVIDQPDVIKKILQHLSLWEQSQAPPESEPPRKEIKDITFDPSYGSINSPSRGRSRDSQLT